MASFTPAPPRLARREHLLVLTTDNTEEIISIMTSFTVHQSDLRDRYIAILTDWAGHPELHDAFRAEIIDILIQWASAPP